MYISIYRLVFFSLPLHCHAKFLVISGTCILWRTSTGSWCCWDSFGFWASSLVDHQQCACRRFPFSFGTSGDAMSWGTKLRVLKTPCLWEMSSNKFFFWNQAGLHQTNHLPTYYDLGFHWKRPSNNPWCWEPKTNWWENFWWTQVMTDDKQLPLQKLGTFLHNHIWWTVMVCVVFDGHWFPAKYSLKWFFATSLHFILYIYIYMDI